MVNSNVIIWSPYNLQSTVYSSSQSYMSCPLVLRWTVRYHRQMRTSMLDILDRQTCRVPRNTPRRIIIATVRLLDSPLLGRKPFTITNTLVTRSPACDSQATNAEIGAEGTGEICGCGRSHAFPKVSLTVPQNAQKWISLAQKGNSAKNIERFFLPYLFVQFS